MIFRVLHYNPLSANQLRLEEILQATRNFSIVGLVATQRRAPVGLELGSSRQFGCAIGEAGWARAPLSNKSSGVLLALRKPFTTNVNNCAHTLVVLVLCIFGTCRAFLLAEVFLTRCPFVKFSCAPVFVCLKGP